MFCSFRQEPLLAQAKMHQSRAQKISITSNATLLTDVSSMFDGLPGKVELISSLHTRIQGKFGNACVSIGDRNLSNHLIPSLTQSCFQANQLQLSHLVEVKFQQKFWKKMTAVSLR